MSVPPVQGVLCRPWQEACVRARGYACMWVKARQTSHTCALTRVHVTNVHTFEGVCVVWACTLVCVLCMHVTVGVRVCARRHQ